MNAPNKFLKVACPTCGTKRSMVNGEYLRSLRLDAGVPLREMARRLNFSAAYLCDVEHNRRNGSPKIRAVYFALKIGAA